VNGDLPRATVGVIGGSGFYEMPGLEVVETLTVDTPYGRPSSAIVLADFEGTHVAFLARHGVGHRYPPHEVPYRANIYALKALGVRRVVGVNAVGSLKRSYEPGHLVLPDDVYDRTWGRPSTFFESGLVAHVAFAEPFCRTVRADLMSALPHLRTRLHEGGTLVVIQGPRFSSRAESRHFRESGHALVGMTSLPEAQLAREAEMCYGAVCMVTDYDVWHDDDGGVTAEIVLERLRDLVGEARTLVRSALPALAARGDCTCHEALATARLTAPDAVDADQARRLGPIIARYLPEA
jgi:5'-methylthioadenosine phosphorylase